MKVLVLCYILFFFIPFSPRYSFIEILPYPYKFIDDLSPTFYMEGGYHTPKLVASFIDRLKNSKHFMDIEIGVVVVAGKNENIPKVHSFLRKVKNLMENNGVIFIIYGSLSDKLQMDVVYW